MIVLLREQESSRDFIDAVEGLWGAAVDDLEERRAGDIRAADLRYRRADPARPRPVQNPCIIGTEAHVRDLRFRSRDYRVRRTLLVTAADGKDKNNRRRSDRPRRAVRHRRIALQRLYRRIIAQGRRALPEAARRGRRRYRRSFAFPAHSRCRSPSSKVAAARRVDGIIALGCVIRGRNAPFRLRRGRVRARRFRGGARTRRSGRVRDSDRRHDRAGYRARRHQGGQQGRGSNRWPSSRWSTSCAESTEQWHRTIQPAHARVRESCSLQALYQKQIAGHDCGELLPQFREQVAYERVDQEYFDEALRGDLQ